MKLRLAIILLAGLMAAGVNGQTLTTNSYSQTVNTIIPDDNPNGVASTISVTGIYGTIVGISVSLNVTNGYNGDLYGYLVNSNGGTFAVLLNRVGVQSGDSFGYSDSGFHVTFADTATDDIHFYQNGSYSLDSDGALLGIWAADGRNIDPGTNAATLGATAPTLTLGSFVGTDPNGDWTLFLADLSGGYEATLQNWQLDITTVPEPGTNLLFGLGAAGMAFMLKRKHRGARSA